MLYNVYPVLVRDTDLPRETGEFIDFLKEIDEELELVKKLRSKTGDFFLVGTQELTSIATEKEGETAGKTRGIFVFAD